MRFSYIFVQIILILVLIQSSRQITPSPKIYKNQGGLQVQISEINFDLLLERQSFNRSLGIFQKISEIDIYDQNFQFQNKFYIQLDKDESLLKPYWKQIEKYLEKRFSNKQNSGHKLNVKILNSIIENLQDENYDNSPQNMIENYKIEIQQIDDQIYAYLNCESYISFLRALESLFQLIENQNTISGIPLLIQDQPSYKWRGIMLDTTRHFLSVQNILKQIEALQVNKMNVLHIHFTDSESFPVEIEEIPELSQYGAYSKSQVYTKDDIREIQNACKESGISLIPEFDSPAHTRSWSNSPKYSDTNACPDYPPEDWEHYCAEPPCGALDPTIKNTWDLIEGVSNYMQKTFTSKNMHMGGDEIFQRCWEYKPAIKEWMNENGIETYKQLETYFRETQAKYFDENKNLIYWLNGDSGDVKFRENDIIQYWDKQETYEMLKKFDNQVILSTYDYLYFDCGQGDPQGWDSWCDPYKTWKHVYQFDPTIADIGDRVIGAEACLWAETISDNNLDNRIWPRATSLALRLWNFQENLNSPQLVKKLVDMNKLLKEKYGMKPSPITTQYCEQNIDMCFFS